MYVVSMQSCSEDDPGCTLIRCQSGFMAKDDSVLIQVRSRIWINTVLMVSVWEGEGRKTWGLVVKVAGTLDRKENGFFNWYVFQL